ncbi:PREDICTED: cystathionine beta-lyase, chloroplastic-like [Erythranthe guttata]|uniref:cystathionine beta-lyase, chloroplastic-like n=1 Tax=Erythranthe guttata TaxID=4155 RepID=UPI00064DB2B4|nr:PREDICTED: cystathionine beta-lyase, chloroplastic-like [Erythranthe guttata]|eukprot:XP_012828011.1 PREDICTED: cystathionine beta-lyase, chloroplastic-like [Erythranthe guttata]
MAASALCLRSLCTSLPTTPADQQHTPHKADRAFCFASGMAALSTVAHLVGTGEEIVAGDDMYGGSDRLLSHVIPKSGVVVKRVDMKNLEKVASAIGPSTKLVWLESPTNPQQHICDIRVCFR